MSDRLLREPQTCYTCEYEWRDGTDEPCVYCYGGSKYKPKDEPQTDRPQGEWIDNGDRYFRCSLCGAKDTDKWLWCHGCGAIMKGISDAV